MSWSMSYTGLPSLFSSQHVIGVFSGNTSSSNPSLQADLAQLSSQADLRLFFVETGTEQSVRSGASTVATRVLSAGAPFFYMVSLSQADHGRTPADLEKRLAEHAAKLGVQALDVVLVPWPAGGEGDGGVVGRHARRSQASLMRQTWDTLTLLRAKVGGGGGGGGGGGVGGTSPVVRELGLYDLETWQVEALVSPSVPERPPSLFPRANFLSQVSPWKSQMERINFCQSRGIEVLGRLLWFPPSSPPPSSVSSPSSDPLLHSLCLKLDRTPLQVVTLWALNHGLVSFPDLSPLLSSTPTAALAPGLTPSDKYDMTRTYIHEGLSSVSLLMDPLFRRKPKWREAFELDVQDMKDLDALDETFRIMINGKPNEGGGVGGGGGKVSNTSKPPVSSPSVQEDGDKNKGRSSPVVVRGATPKRKEDEDQDKDKDTGKEAWEAEYTDFYAQQARDEEKRRARAAADLLGDDEATAANEKNEAASKPQPVVLRNVDKRPQEVVQPVVRGDRPVAIADDDDDEEEEDGSLFKVSLATPGKALAGLSDEDTAKGGGLASWFDALDEKGK